MREHVRELIRRARRGTDASAGAEQLAAEAIRLARIASAVHLAETARDFVERDRAGRADAALALHGEDIQ